MKENDIFRSAVYDLYLSSIVDQKLEDLRIKLSGNEAGIMGKC